MKVQVYNPMVKLIREILEGSGIKVKLEKFTPDDYSIKVDYDLFRNERDYDNKTGMFKAICLYYPAEMYAMPRYITTRDLIQIFRDHNTYPAFMDGIKSFCMI